MCYLWTGGGVDLTHPLLICPVVLLLLSGSVQTMEQSEAETLLRSVSRWTDVSTNRRAALMWPWIRWDCILFFKGTYLRFFCCHTLLSPSSNCTPEEYVVHLTGV